MSMTNIETRKGTAVFFNYEGINVGGWCGRELNLVVERESGLWESPTKAPSPPLMPSESTQVAARLAIIESSVNP